MQGAAAQKRYLLLLLLHATSSERKKMLPKRPYPKDSLASVICAIGGKDMHAMRENSTEDASSNRPKRRHLMCRDVNVAHGEQNIAQQALATMMRSWDSTRALPTPRPSPPERNAFACKPCRPRARDAFRSRSTQSALSFADFSRCLLASEATSSASESCEAFASLAPHDAALSGDVPLLMSGRSIETPKQDSLIKDMSKQR